MSDNITGYRGEETIPVKHTGLECLTAAVGRCVQHGDEYVELSFDDTGNVQGELVALRKQVEEQVKVATPAEAVFAFGAGLTCLNGSITLGGSHDASVMAQMCEGYRLAQEWPAPRDNYTDFIKRASLDAYLPAAKTEGQYTFSRAQLKNLLIVVSGPITNSLIESSMLAEHVLERYDNEPLLRDLVSQED